MTYDRPQYEYRITKYDPANRDASGRYALDEWTMYRDVEKGKVPEAEYLTAEANYIAAAQAIMRDAGVDTLTLTGLETARYKGPPLPSTISVDDIGTVLRALLREEYWARLEAPETFIHIGHDFYMYVGADIVRPDTFDAIEATGLFVEPFKSPYYPQEDDE